MTPSTGFGRTRSIFGYWSCVTALRNAFGFDLRTKTGICIRDYDM